MEELALFRSAKLSDLDAFIGFSGEAEITSLPQNPKVLEERLDQSHRSFQEPMRSPENEIYLFCLEYKGEVIGASGLFSRIGMQQSFFAYHLLKEKQRCNYLKIDREIEVLHFIRAQKRPTEVGSLFVKKAFRQKGFGKLLSFARFLFIAIFRYRFAPTVIAELEGVNIQGYSPFWEAVGKHFLGCDFLEADLLRTNHPKCIEELFPTHPIYLRMLPLAAQDVFGKPHPNAIAAKKLLEKQGFKKSSYYDLFDGGPHLYAPTDDILAVKESHNGVVGELRSEITNGKRAIISNQKLAFRACVASILEEKMGIVIHPNVSFTLQVDVGDPVHYYIL